MWKEGTRMQVLKWTVVAVLVLSVMSAARASAEELREELTFFAPLVGTTWVGHYSNAEVAHFVHAVRWEPVLSGRAVRATKRVEELDFSMETLCYWDAGSGQVRFLSLTNRGQLLRGSASWSDGLVELTGEQIADTGATPFMQTYRVLTNGELEDRFYLKGQGEWVEQHLIEYAPDTSDDADPVQK